MLTAVTHIADGMNARRLSVHDRFRLLGWRSLWLVARYSLDVWLGVPSTTSSHAAPSFDARPRARGK
jgi:hypothetical protein